MRYLLSAASLWLAAFSLSFPLSAQVFPPDFGQPRLQFNPIALPPSVNRAPSSVQTVLSNTSGGTVTLRFSVEDPNGSNDINNFYALINSTLSTNNGCLIHVQTVDETIRVANDRADAWTSLPKPLRTTEPLANSNCSIVSAAVARYSTIGFSTRADISLTLTLSPSFAGVKKGYTYVDDLGGLFRNWTEDFTYTVADASAPQIGTTSFASSNPALNQYTVTAQFTDGNGNGDLDIAYLLINDTFTTANGCLLEINLSRNTVRVANDAATDWLASTLAFSGGARVVANSYCAVREGQVFVGRSGQAGQDNFAYAFANNVVIPSPRAGNLNAYWFVQDRAGTGSGWKSAGSVVPTVVPAGDPNAGKNPPTVGLTNGAPPPVREVSTEEISFSAFDLDSPADLSLIYLLVNTTATGAGGCLVEFDPAARAIRLATDSGTSWIGPPMVVGADASTPLSNSQCTVDAKRSKVTGFGTNGLGGNLTIYVTAKTSFAGSRSVFGYAVDKTARNSGWVQLGTWNVPGEVAPTLVLERLPSGRETATNSYSMKLTFTDRNGPETLKQVQLMVGGGRQAFSNACNLRVLPVGAGVWALELADDSGSFSNVARLVSSPTQTGRLANSQCEALSFFPSTLSPTQGKLFISFGIRFFPKFNGLQQVNTLAEDLTGQSSGWATWDPLTVLAGDAQPRIINVFTAPTTPIVSTITGFTVHDPLGIAKDMLVDVRVGKSTEAAGSCWAQYDTSTNGFRLSNEAGTAIAPTLLTFNTDLQNSRCELNGFDSRVIALTSSLETQLPLRLGFRFTPALAGLNKVFVRITRGGVAGDWQSIADYSVPVSTVPSMQVSLNSTSPAPSGTVVANLNAIDTFESRNLTNGYLLVNSTLNTANGCFLWHNFANNELRLANDAGTAWGPPLASVPDAKLANGNCEVSGNTSALKIVGLQGFSGTKNFFTSITNKQGLQSGWQQGPSWVFAASAAPTIKSSQFGAQPAQIVGYGTQADILLESRDVNGARDVRRVSLLFGSSPQDPQACQVEYDLNTKRYSIYNDSNTAILASADSSPRPPEGTPYLSNSRCELYAALQSEPNSQPSEDTSLNRTFFRVRFKTPSADIMQIFGKADDQSGASSGWQVLGTWTSPGAARPKIELSNVVLQSLGLPTPSTIRFSLEDGDGFVTLGTAYFIIRNGNTTANACFVGVDLQNKVVRLAADSGQSWVDPSRPMGTLTPPLVNSQCSVQSVTVDRFTSRPNNGTLVIDLQFTNAFRGPKRLEAYVEDQSGLNSGWLWMQALDIH